MFGLKFNPFRSMTLQGALVAAGTYVLQHADPQALSPGLQVGLQVAGVLWSVLGLRNAVAKGLTP
jgi:hypothetical protein